MSDPDIVGFEINNEPCHSGTSKQTKAYIDGMLAALKKAGNRKPVFYNVSHNMYQLEAYSVVIYTDRVSFWSDDNASYPMERVNGYTYRAVIPAEEIQRSYFRYNIIVCQGGNHYTFPLGTDRNLLDWDYTASACWSSKVVAPGSTIKLFSVTDEEYRSMESYTIPEGSWLQQEVIPSSPMEENILRFFMPENKEPSTHYLRKYMADETAGRKERLAASANLCLHINKGSADYSGGFYYECGVYV